MPIKKRSQTTFDIVLESFLLTFDNYFVKMTMRRYSILIFTLCLFSCGEDAKNNIYLDGHQIIILDETIEESKENNKETLIYFTSLASVNCRYFEESVFRSKEIIQQLSQNYNFIPLYVDDRTEIGKNHWIESKFTGDTLKTIGAINIDLQLSITKSGHQPQLVRLNENGGVVKIFNYSNHNLEFLDFLN